MTAPYLLRQRFPDSVLWQHLRASQRPVQFMLEITSRCGLNCRHCYINRSTGDREARLGELSCAEILDIARQAVDLGAFWCTLTGGDPLLREDFFEIYLGLKRLGLLVYIYTNGTLITSEHAKLFHDYPPRDLYVTAYGATQETYERVTRRPGSYAAFRHGLSLLEDAGVPVCFKAIALRSNWQELSEIVSFCHARTGANKPKVHVGNMLHLRIDGDAARNAEIVAERLTTQEILACRLYNDSAPPAPDSEVAHMADPHRDSTHLLQCNAGKHSYAVGHDGRFRLCVSLTAPETTYDLRTGTLREAIEDFTPRVRAMQIAPSSPCGGCTRRSMCAICPAYAFLETGALDGKAEHFCEVATARIAENAACTGQV